MLRLQLWLKWLCYLPFVVVALLISDLATLAGWPQWWVMMRRSFWNFICWPINSRREYKAWKRTVDYLEADRKRLEAELAEIERTRPRER